MKVKGYVYQADVWCEDCVAEALQYDVAKNFLILERVNWESAEQYLDRIAGLFKINRSDEHTYDTGDFPKVLLEVAWEDGVPYHCTSCQEQL